MPDDRYWTGTTDGVVTTATNYEGGVAPIAGDSVYARVSPINPMASGTFPNLVNFVISEAYGQNNIGSASTAVGFGTVTAMKIASRGQAVYLTATTITAVSFEMPNGSTAVLTGGTWTTITGTNVRVEAGASAIVTNIQSNASVWDMATNGTAITSYVGSGTLMVNSRNVTTMTLDGPTSRAVVKGASAVTTANILSGARCVHQSSGTMTTANLRGPGSTLTPAGNPNATATVTTANVWTGAEIVRSVPGCTLAVTTVNFIGPESSGTVQSD